MWPKCVCLGKSLMVIFLSLSKKKKLHIDVLPFWRVENVGKFSVISLKSVTMIIKSRLDSFKQHNFTMIGFPVLCQNRKKNLFTRFLLKNFVLHYFIYGEHEDFFVQKKMKVFPGSSNAHTHNILHDGTHTWANL